MSIRYWELDVHTSDPLQTMWYADSVHCYRMCLQHFFFQTKMLRLHIHKFWDKPKGTHWIYEGQGALLLYNLWLIPLHPALIIYPQAVELRYAASRWPSFVVTVYLKYWLIISISTIRGYNNQLHTASLCRLEGIAKLTSVQENSRQYPQTLGCVSFIPLVYEHTTL